MHTRQRVGTSIPSDFIDQISARWTCSRMSRAGTPLVRSAYLSFYISSRYISALLIPRQRGRQLHFKMSNLTFIEKGKLEKRLNMGGGYVLDFSNRTFQEFVLDCTGLNIYDSKYDNASGSKANRLRTFWSIEPNHIVGKLLLDLLENPAYLDKNEPDLSDNCRRIAQRLLQAASVQDIDAIMPNADDRDFDQLAKLVKNSIEKNEPELGLDRLHTFVVKYNASSL